MKPLKIEQIRYLLVGGYNTAFGYILFVLLLAMFHDKVNYLILLIVSHIISVTNAYLAYKFFVFKTQGYWLHEFGKFNIVYLGVLSINLIVLPGLVELLAMNPAIAQGCFVVMTVIASYLGHKHFSFKTAKL